MARPKRAIEKGTKNIVGGRVRAARLAHLPPLDQADLAEALSCAVSQPVGRTTISRLEAGDRPVTDIEVIALARVLGVSAAWLLYGEGD